MVEIRPGKSDHHEWHPYRVPFTREDREHGSKSTWPPCGVGLQITGRRATLLWTETSRRYGPRKLWVMRHLRRSVCTTCPPTSATHVSSRACLQKLTRCTTKMRTKVAKALTPPSGSMVMPRSRPHMSDLLTSEPRSLVANIILCLPRP